jgi:hypothetical protein
MDGGEENNQCVPAQPEQFASLTRHVGKTGEPGRLACGAAALRQGFPNRRVSVIIDSVGLIGIF